MLGLWAVHGSAPPAAVAADAASFDGLRAFRDSASRDGAKTGFCRSERRTSGFGAAKRDRRETRERHWLPVLRIGRILRFIIAWSWRFIRMNGAAARENRMIWTELEFNNGAGGGI
jgi:hypothetical protein